MRVDSNADGYLLLNKQSGQTSFDSLNCVKRGLGTRRVGHSGTLDKFATGLLVVLVGRSTRLVPWFTGCDKVYEGTIIFGTETDTLDPEGEVISTAPIPTQAQIETVIPSFIGDIMQSPPAYSSIHIDGKRAHELVRAGKEVEMKLRPISIYNIELLSYFDGKAQVKVHCSKGTYIRSLARDLGRAAGSCAYLGALTRIEVGAFTLSEAFDGFANEKENTDLWKSQLRPIDENTFASLHITSMRVGSQIQNSLSNGKILNSEWFPELSTAVTNAPLAICDEKGFFVAILEYEMNKWVYRYVSSRPIL